MSPVLAVLNRKGGVGKTTTTFHLGGALASLGNRVLLIDADPQGSLTQIVIGTKAFHRLDPAETAAALFAPTLRPKAAKLIQGTDFPRLSFIPGGAGLEAYDTPLPRDLARGDKRRLAAPLAELAGFDAILIDCPPTLRRLSWAALTAASGLLVPVVPEDLGAQGVVTLGEFMAQVAEDKPDPLELAGFLITRFNKRLSIHQEFDRDLRDEYGAAVLDHRCPESADVKEATGRRMPITSYKPRSRSAAAFLEAAAELKTRIEGASTTHQIAGVI